MKAAHVRLLLPQPCPRPASALLLPRTWARHLPVTSALGTASDTLLWSLKVRETWKGIRKMVRSTYKWWI